MNEFINDLIHTDLFNGISPNALSHLLNCIDAKVIQYEKDDYIIEEGDYVYDFGIILSGKARSIKWYAENQQTIITLLKKNSEIGVLIAASIDHKSPVSVQAQSDVTVLFIPFSKIITRCSKGCLCHDKLLQNYINIVAQKGLILHERIDCLLKPSIREKVISYLFHLYSKNKCATFDIPLNRNEMAEYLNVERSALSRELSNMKKDGLIDYRKNNFTLLSLNHSFS